MVIGKPFYFEELSIGGTCLNHQQGISSTIHIKIEKLILIFHYFIQDFADGWGVPGAMDGYILHWKNKNLALFKLETFQRFLKNQ